MQKQTFVCNAGSAIKSVYTENGMLFFAIESLFVKLSYHGTDGWRLQTNKKDFSSAIFVDFYPPFMLKYNEKF